MRSGDAPIAEPRFRARVEEVLAAAHGREHPLYAYWVEAVVQGIDHQAGLIDVLSRVSGIPVEGARALDVGCGLGAGCIAFVRRGAAEVFGVDLRLGGLGLDLAALRLREAGAKAALTCSDAQRLPFRDGSIDLCFCDQLLEHVPDSGAVIGEIARVLRPGGAAYLGTPNRLAVREAHSGLYFAHWLPPHLCERYVKWRGRRAPSDLWDVQPRTFWTLRREAHRHGLRIVGSLGDALEAWERRWSGPKRLLARAYRTATRYGVPLDPFAPSVALVVVRPRR